LNKPLIVVGAFVALLAAPAQAESWLQLADSSQAVAYGDADSVAPEGDYVSAKVMLGLRQPMGANANIEFLVSSLRISCSEGRYFVDSVAGLDSSRKAISSLPGSREWQDISEGTLQASFRDFACGKALARPVADPFAATGEFWNGETHGPGSGAFQLAGQFDMG
jgi:hypothetical protein